MRLNKLLSIKLASGYSIVQDYCGVELFSLVELTLPLENIGTVINLDPDKTCLISGVYSYLLGVANYQESLLWILDTYQFLNLETDSNFSTKSLTAIIIKNLFKEIAKK